MDTGYAKRKSSTPISTSFSPNKKANVKFYPHALILSTASYAKRGSRSANARSAQYVKTEKWPVPAFAVTSVKNILANVTTPTTPTKSRTAPVKKAAKAAISTMVAAPAIKAEAGMGPEIKATRATKTPKPTKPPKTKPDIG